MAWVKTTRNYIISKAQEMEHLLLWAEGLQSTPVTDHHILHSSCAGHCMDHDPTKLGRDLWGHLNLAIPVTSGDRVAFDSERREMDSLPGGG